MILPERFPDGGEVGDIRGRCSTRTPDAQSAGSPDHRRKAGQRPWKDSVDSTDQPPRADEAQDGDNGRHDLVTLLGHGFP